MTFRLTYSTMFNPPPELHERFDHLPCETAGREQRQRPADDKNERRLQEMALSYAPRGRCGDKQAELGGGTCGERSRLGHERQLLSQVCVEPIAFVPCHPVSGQG